MLEGGGRAVEAVGVEGLGGRDEPDRRLDHLPLTVATPEDPLQYAAVLTVARPDELAVLVLAEPVDEEDARHLVRMLAPELEPVGEVVGHVVAAERQHRHRVEAELSDLAR